MKKKTKRKTRSKPSTAEPLPLDVANPPVQEDIRRAVEDRVPIPPPGNPGPLARMPALSYPPRYPFHDIR